MKKKLKRRKDGRLQRKVSLGIDFLTGNKVVKFAYGYTEAELVVPARAGVILSFIQPNRCDKVCLEFPKKLQKIILKGKEPQLGRPGDTLPPVDFAVVRKHLEEEGATLSGTVVKVLVQKDQRVLRN